MGSGQPGVGGRGPQLAANALTGGEGIYDLRFRIRPWRLEPDTWNPRRRLRLALLAGCG